MKPMSERQLALRRTRGKIYGRKYAWVLKPGDLIHTPSVVFVVVSVENGVENERFPASERTTAVEVIDEPYDDGRTVTRTMRYKPQQELLVFRPPKES